MQRRTKAQQKAFKFFTWSKREDKYYINLAMRTLKSVNVQITHQKSPIRLPRAYSEHGKLLS